MGSILNNSRNLILAVILSALLLFGWDAAMGWLYPQPVEVQQAEKADTPQKSPRSRMAAMLAPSARGR